MVFCSTHETLAVVENTVDDFGFGFCQVSRAIVQTVDISPPKGPFRGSSIAFSYNPIQKIKTIR